MQAEIRAACSRRLCAVSPPIGETHPLHPVPHGPAECDLTAAGADGLGLQVEQDHPGPGAIGHAIGHDPAAGFHAAGFYPERDAVALLFPGLLIRQALVRQAG